MFYLFLVSFVWAFSFVLIKGVLTGVDSFVVSFIRLSISLFIFLPFLKFKKLDRKIIFSLVLCGAVQYGVMYISYISAYKFLPAHIIVLMTVFTPLWVVLFDDLLNKTFSLKIVFVAFLAVLGGAVIKYPQAALSFNIKGILLIQVSNVAFALGQIYYRRLSKKFNANYKQINVFGWLYLGAVLFTLPFFISSGAFALTLKQVMTLLYLGVVASGLCFFWWNKGAVMVSGGVLAVMNNIKIPLGVLAVLIILGEDFSALRLIIGGLSMLVALLIASKYNKV